MNILILANKADIKDYTAVIKTVPNASVLGTVVHLKKSFIQEIKSKWQPHVLIIDTAVKSDVDLGVLLKEIAYFYPYIKTIVLTDEEDGNVYNCFAVIRGQISNTQLGELINNVSADSTAPMVSSEDKRENVDNLSTQEPKVREVTKPVKVKKQKVKKSFRFEFNPIIVGVIALSVLIIIIVASLAVKSCSSETGEQQETYNTATTVATQENTLIVSFTEPTTSAVVIATVQQDTVSVYPTIPSAEKNTVAVPKNESSDTEKKEESRTDDEKSDNENSQYEHSSAENEKQEADVVFDNNSYNNEQNKNEVSSVRLSYSQITLTEKEELWLTATVTPSGTGNKLSWESSNESVASVSYGKVSAKRAGTCTITAYCGGKSASCVVVVKEKATQAPVTEVVDNVYISPSKKTLSTNEIFTVTLQNCDKCSFTISNPALVQVVGGGNNRIQLKTKAVGTVSITATSDDTGKSYTSVITIA